MTRVAWERYEGNDIEAVVAMLINLKRPNSVRITPSRGDGGVDILDRGAAAKGGDVVYQVKRYTGPLSTTQQKNVEESWTRLQTDPRWATLDVQEWHLVTPWDPTPEAEAWLQGLDDSAHTVVWHGLTYIEALAAKYPEVIDYYLEGGKSRIEEAYQAVVALLAPADASQTLDVPTVSSKLAKALTVLDGDPHYRYELRLGDGELPGLIKRPNLMMTWIQSDGPGKKWQAVDVIARCAASATERPIVISGTVSAEGGSDLATALQDFFDYGAPFAAPAGAFAGSIDAPGGLGGPLTNAAMQVLPVDDEVGADPDLILTVRTAEGVTIAETEVTRVERSEGTKGLRVVLQQKNNVFAIEDRYTASEGGKRQFRFGDYSNQPALDVRNALAFITSASPPNSVHVRRKGAPPLSATVDPNWIIAFPDEIREVLDGIAVPVDALARLQQHTGAIVRVPDLTETTFAQVAEWRRAATILEGKEAIAAYPEAHALGVELPAEVDTISGPLAIEVPLDVVIGQQKIHFGTALMWIEDATILERREVEGRLVHWLTTPNRRIRFSLPKDHLGDTAG
ncbi:restriction endonuclease [Microbacterium esteraromaticum]|uniref:Restriction endonuclease n=1 Tax=Microbacterium esteraromaticum TaxID=57043 RepID=A0A939DV61_9MICO|nr:restriction endonuclease [Microbacterium esteraromaticum]MBN8204887.1 restriction endonuclease [Microbacterium esteraromaticum]MBN8415041.1 restriction endonuclease [Microbacterium esteraromaticum]